MIQAFIREHYQITLPREIREKLPIQVGDPVEIYVTRHGKIEISILKTISASQAWFWTQEHQRAEREAQQEIHTGKGKRSKNTKDLTRDLNT